MSTELATSNPFAIGQRSGALANIEAQRAVQEVQAALVIAKRFPRDEKAALDRIVNSCSRRGLAEQSQYSYSRGGTEICGPSIRLLEAIAQHWGNVEFGFREIGRGAGADGVTYSEVEAYAWDMETNTRRPARFTVRHWRDTRQGGYPLKEERDIYELIANQAQRRVRSCLQAVIPGDVVEEAAKQCDITLKANADTSPEGVAKMVAAFAQFGVTKEQIEKKIQRRIDSITAAQIVTLKKVYASLKDGMSSPADWFEQVEKQEPAATGENPFAKKVQPEPEPEAATEPAPQLAERSGTQRRDGALEEIDRQLAENFDEPVTRAKFEGMLRKQGLLSATGTLMGKKLADLEALVGRVHEIIEKANGEGGEG